MNHQELENRPIAGLLLQYSLPAIIGMLVTSLYNIVDRIFIGHIEGVGANAISGLGATMPITTVMLAFSMLVGLGATANISLCLGRGRKAEAQTLLGHTLTLILIISALLTAAGLLYLNPILRMFGASEETLPYARQYMVIILAGSVFNMASFALNHTIRADGSPVTAGATMMIGCVINIILDPILIFVCGWGVEGAAIATVFSQMISSLWVIRYYLSGKSKLKFTLWALRPSRKTTWIIFAAGLSSFLMQIAFSIIQAITNNRMRELSGDTGIGAYAIVGPVIMLFLMPLFGVSQGMQPIIGYNYGRKLFSRVKKTFKTAVIWGTAYLALGFVLMECFPGVFISLFNDDETLLAMAVTGLRYDALSVPLLGFVVLGTALFMYIGKPRISLMLNVIRQFVFLIPCLFFLPDLLGLDGVWLSMPLCDGVGFVLVLFCIVRLMRNMERENLNALT